MESLYHDIIMLVLKCFLIHKSIISLGNYRTDKKVLWTINKTTYLKTDVLVKINVYSQSNILIFYRYYHHI